MARHRRVQQDWIQTADSVSGEGANAQQSEETVRLGFSLVLEHPAGVGRRVSEKCSRPKQCLELNMALA